MSWSINSTGEAQNVADEFAQLDQVPRALKDFVRTCANEACRPNGCGGMTLETSGEVGEGWLSVTLKLRGMRLAKPANPPETPQPAVTQVAPPTPAPQ